jgi:hypothetical protein
MLKHRGFADPDARVIPRDVNMANNRILVGYWCDDGASESWIHPRHLVDASWESEDRNRIVGYLRSVAVVAIAMGYSHCRFRHGQPDEETGCCELSDGTWVWPEGLWVYVDRYKVRLPDAFVAHMKERDFIPPTDVAPLLVEEGTPMYNETFWRQWCAQERRKRPWSFLRRLVGGRSSTLPPRRRGGKPHRPFGAKKG